MAEMEFETLYPGRYTPREAEWVKSYFAANNYPRGRQPDI
jgi:hypothetical protein